jgi:hypothetical protein
VIDITHAGKRAAAPDAPERFDNRSATFSVISVSPSFRLADRWFPRLDSPFLPCLVEPLSRRSQKNENYHQKVASQKTIGKFCRVKCTRGAFDRLWSEVVF